MRRLALMVALLVALITLVATGSRLLRHGSPQPKLPHRTPASAPAALPQPPPLPGLHRWRADLALDGRPVRLTGVNAYGATTWYGTNWGCGAPVYSLDRMFSELRPGSLVRTWAFQAMGWNNKDHPQHQDFFALDRVVQAAERHHQLLVLTLSDQAGTCDDGHWHDQAWYDGGYRQRWNDDGRGLSDRSYADWVTAVVTRYRDSPAVAVWEPVNEPEASECRGATGGGCFDPARRACPPRATESLRRFFDEVGARIHQLDPGSVVGLGTNAGGQCGIADTGFASVGASPEVDLLSYHDYGAESNPLPTGLTDRLAQAQTLGKPLLVGEVGVQGGSTCRSKTERAALVKAKVDAALAAGADGWLPWWYSDGTGTCGDDFGPDDPLLAALTSAPR